MWLPLVFIEHREAAALSSRIALSSKLHKPCKEGTLTTYNEVLNYLLKTHGTDENIAEMDAKILQFTQPSKLMPTEYADALCSKELGSDLYRDEYVLKEVLIEGLHDLIGHSMR